MKILKETTIASLFDEDIIIYKAIAVVNNQEVMFVDNYYKSDKEGFKFAHDQAISCFKKMEDRSKDSGVKPLDILQKDFREAVDSYDSV